MKGDRALIFIYLDNMMAIFDLGHLQEINWGQRLPVNKISVQSDVIYWSYYPKPLPLKKKKKKKEIKKKQLGPDKKKHCCFF